MKMVAVLAWSWLGAGSPCAMLAVLARCWVGVGGLMRINGTELRMLCRWPLAGPLVSLGVWKCCVAARWFRLFGCVVVCVVLGWCVEACWFRLFGCVVVCVVLGWCVASCWFCLCGCVVVCVAWVVVCGSLLGYYSLRDSLVRIVD